MGEIFISDDRGHIEVYRNGEKLDHTSAIDALKTLLAAEKDKNAEGAVLLREFIENLCAS